MNCRVELFTAMARLFQFFLADPARTWHALGR